MIATTFRRVGLAFAFVTVTNAPLHSQTLTLQANLNQTVPSPTEAEYNSAAPGNVTGQNTTTDFSVKLTCGGTKHGCELDAALGTPPSGGALDVQWRISSVDNASNCGNPVVGGSFHSVTAASQILNLSGHGQVCTLSLQFQVGTLSYATHTAPGPGGIATAYTQPVILTAVQN